MKLNPYLAIILAATIGGSSGVFVKLLDLPATTLTFFRMFIPVIILAFYFWFKKVRLFRGNYRIMILASALNSARMFLFFLAFLYTTIGNAIIILYTWPVFAVIFSAIYLKEKIHTKTILLISLAFTGIIIMYSNNEISFGNRDFIGMASMLFSAIMFSMTAVIFKKELSNYSKTQTIFYQNFLGAFLFIPFLFINQPPSPIQTAVASVYGFLIGIVAFLLFFYALGKLKMSHYSLFTFWEVPAALTFGVIFFNEQITWNMILGGTFILTAGILLRKEKH